MSKLMGKKIFTILRTKNFLIWIYVDDSIFFENSSLIELTLTSNGGSSSSSPLGLYESDFSIAVL